MNAVVLTAGVNLVVNALIAWVSIGSTSSVPLWAVPLLDEPSTITDTVGTFFLLPLITCVMLTTVVRAQRRRGHLSSGRPVDAGPWLGRLPAGRVRRGAALGAVCCAVLSPIALLVLVIADFGDVSRTTFVVYKAALGVALGAIITPVIAVRALADPLTEPRRRALAGGRR
ncbi:MAG: hypothetical protein QOE63_1763 [Acidimicrobiaceae bacterium]